MTAIRDQYPFKLTIGGEDCTFLLDEGATFSNVDPGGFEAASFPIPKDMPNTLVGQNVRLDCGLQTAWEGRVSEVQRSLGNRTLIRCQGYGAKFKEKQLSEIFVDRDFTKWQSPSVQRQLNVLSGGGFSPVGPQILVGPGFNKPALTTQIVGSWESASKPLIEAWYDSHGILIDNIYYRWERGPAVNPADANWTWEVGLGRFYNTEPERRTGNLRAEGPGEGVLVRGEPVASPIVAVVQLYYGAGPAGGPNDNYSLYWTQLAVYGGHGLAKRGSEPGGFYPSDIAKWVAGQVPGIQLGICPDMSTFIVPHAVYLDPVSAERMVEDMAILAGWHWGVWEPLSITGNQEPRFDFREYPEAGTWAASFAREDCDTLDLYEQLDKMYDECYVTYTDMAGVQRSVHVTRPNAYLAAAGLSKRSPDAPINGGMMTEASAKAFGEISLAILERQAAISGHATITGLIDGESGKMPPWMLRSGLNRARIRDLPGSDAFGTRNDVAVKRVETTLSREGFSTSLEFGTGANLIETTTARLADATLVAGLH